MKLEGVHNKGQARIFRNPVLEMLTISNPLVIWGMYIPLLSYLLIKGINTTGFSSGKVSLIFFSGTLFWTFFEYVFHRFVFHWVNEHPVISRLTFILHGNHHHYPRDRRRLFMPPLPSLLISGSLLGIMYLFMNRTAFIFYPGFMIGYLLYATMHYAIHAWHPPFKWMKALWRNHHLHHYTHEEKGFGVSSLLWDKIFGTSFDLTRHKEDQAKARALMFSTKGQCSKNCSSNCQAPARVQPCHQHQPSPHEN
jgi:sterol desaturase/sphingolipid hydroxylase (fatty acid hydroxylase superfamily)